MTTTRTDLEELADDITRSAKTISDNVHDVGEGARRYDHETLFELRQIERMAAEAIALQVKRARNSGASWDTIGDALNVTRQAAWERYSTKES